MVDQEYALNGGDGDRFDNRLEMIPVLLDLKGGVDQASRALQSLGTQPILEINQFGMYVSGGPNADRRKQQSKEDHISDDQPGLDRFRPTRKRQNGILRRIRFEGAERRRWPVRVCGGGSRCGCRPYGGIRRNLDRGRFR